MSQIQWSPNVGPDFAGKHIYMFPGKRYPGRAWRQSLFARHDAEQFLTAWLQPDVQAALPAQIFNKLNHAWQAGFIRQPAMFRPDTEAHFRMR